MSGFGVIGVVMGLWHVVLKDVAVDDAAKGGRVTGLLLNELRTEEIIFRESIFTLFSLGGIKEDLIQVSEADKSNIRFWESSGLQTNVERCLGLDKSKLVLETLIEIKKALARLEKRLIVHDTHLKDSPGKPFNNIQKPNLENLRYHNNNLQRLLSFCTGSNVLAHDSPPVALSAEKFERISLHARNLYMALLDCFRCSCPFPHRAGLRLCEVSPGAINVGEQFELFVSLDETNVNQKMKKIEESEDLSASNPSQQSWSPTLGKGGVQRPRFATSSTPREHQELSLSLQFISHLDSKDDLKDERLIDDLCTFIKNSGDLLNPVPSSSLYALALSKEKYAVKKDSSIFSSPLCLDDDLVPHQKWDITRKGRMELALRLSLTILTLYSTPWIDMWWTWKDFYTLKDDRSQIFITRAFHGTHSTSSKHLDRSDIRSKSIPLFWSVYGEPILTRLGFALIELALGKRLSEFQVPSDNPDLHQDMIDVMTAKELLSSGLVMKETGQIYQDAVQACLTHQAVASSGIVVLDSRNPNFQEDLERFVVAPIRDFHLATWGQTFNVNFGLNLDLAPKTTQSALELDINPKSLLEINKQTTEPDWISYEWEVPEVLRLRCRQGEQWMSLSESLRTTIVLIGYDFHYEAATCEGYLKKEWGSLGVEILDVIISSIGDSPKSPPIGDYIRNCSLEPNKFSVLCCPNLSRIERNSVVEALDWLCRAIRIPASPGNLSVSSSNRQLVRSLVRDSKVHQDLFSGSSEQSVLSHSELQLSFHLQKQYILPKSQELCWRALFESGVVAMRSCHKKPELSNKTSARGLEVSFELMVQLSAVELPVLVDGGIVLVGYQTALVPIFSSEDSMQWHLETDDTGRINPYELKSTKKGWLKHRDWKSFKNMRCFVGWCSSAHINLGTSTLMDRVGWSDSKSQKRTLHWSGISLGFQAATANPIQIGFTVQANFSFVPNRINFTPSNSFAKLLRDTSKEVAAVIDCLDGRSWIVPKLSLMLHMAHAWSARNSIDPDPIPYAKPCHDGTQAEAVLRDSGDLVLLGQGQDTLTLRQLMLGLNVNLLQSRHQTEDAASGKVFGFEFMDIVCEPPMGGNMKRASVKSPGKCWFSIVNKADAVVLCANLGQAISPVDENNERNPNCNILPPGSGYLAVPLSCLTELILRQGRQDLDLNEKQTEIFKISDDHFWKISGNPFDDCTHGGQQTQTCWERENLLQKLTKRGSLNGILRDAKQIHACTYIYPSGAVVFGERSVRMEVYSIRRFLGGETLNDMTVQESVRNPT